MENSQEIQAQIELYVTIGTDEQNAALDQQLASLPLERVVNATLWMAGVTQHVMLTILITDDATIQDMNNQYRQQSKPTDVLSFPLLDGPLVNAPADQLWTPAEPEEITDEKTVFIPPPDLITNIGDIVISWPTVQQQAATVGHSAAYELLYLVSHGVLHLIGYDDHSEAGYQAMVRIQEHVLQSPDQQN